MATDYMGHTDSADRKGSLFLRSEHMNYSRATLNSNWHQARESEPKDYDISRDNVRDLCKATYHRIGNVTQGELPNTTYHEFADQANLKDEFTEQEPKKSMITPDTFGHAELDREKLNQRGDSGVVLPRHHPEYNKYHLETTHLTDYKPPYPFTPAEEKPKEYPEYSAAYKKCHSQFTDGADYRRGGRNTWQDESGVYTNSHFKQQAPVYDRKDPILAAFQ